MVKRGNNPRQHRDDYHDNRGRGRGQGRGYQGRGRDGRGGGRDGGRGGRGRGGGGGGGGRGAPRPVGPITTVTNSIVADLSPGFKFYHYSCHSADKNDKEISSLGRRRYLFNCGLKKVLPKMPEPELENLKNQIFFQGSTFFSSRPIPGLEPHRLPRDICDGTETDLDVMTVKAVQCFGPPPEMKIPPIKTSASETVVDRRCSGCTKAFTNLQDMQQHSQATGHAPVVQEGAMQPSTRAIFLSFANSALKRAMSLRMKSWGTFYFDEKSGRDLTDRNGRSLGVSLYRAIYPEFSLATTGTNKVPQLTLTVDLRAKLIRKKSLLDTFYDGYNPAQSYDFTKKEQDSLRRQWVGSVIISKLDKKSYSVHDIDFGHSPASRMIDDLGISHEEYYAKRKGFKLQYPRTKPMIAVPGRNKSIIFLPAEIVCGNELDPKVKEMLPKEASFSVQDRSAAIEEVKRYLRPGAQKSKGGSFLPALGITIRDSRLRIPAEILPIPFMKTANMEIPAHMGSNWAQRVASAKFSGGSNRITLAPIVVTNSTINWQPIYNKIKDVLNGFNCRFRMPDRPYHSVTVGPKNHWREVEKIFSGPKRDLPNNIFVLDFVNPKGDRDTDYPTVKGILGQGGYLSQFVNFKKCRHDNPRNDKDRKQSTIILSRVASQMINKCGVLSWFVQIPKVPLPAMFVGIDVFHAPRTYDPKTQSKRAKESVAGIVTLIIDARQGQTMQVMCYQQTFKRNKLGEEYHLGDDIKTTVSNSMKNIGVAPKSCFVVRDGVSDMAVPETIQQEIPGIQKAFANRSVPIAYMICQKRIATKFVDQKAEKGLPAGTLVKGFDQVQGYRSFYLNGTAPSFSTPKPVRFIVGYQDAALRSVPLEKLCWDLCHAYQNWAGPVKVPVPCQLAHKLAEFAGNLPDHGQNLNHAAYTNNMYYL